MPVKRNSETLVKTNLLESEKLKTRPVTEPIATAKTGNCAKKTKVETSAA
jgi:hypothetical protein